MNIKYKIIRCDIQDLKLSNDATRFLLYCGDATIAAIAYTGADKIIGFARLYEECPAISAGTWVDKRYRRKGIAKKLWGLIFKKCKMRAGDIEFVTFSKEGKYLVDGLIKASHEKNKCNKCPRSKKEGISYVK